MHERRNFFAFFAVCLALTASALAAPRKSHTVLLSIPRKVPYSKAGDPAGALPGEDTLKIRALLVDGAVKDWTTGDLHDVTDRSFVVRRALRLNDMLPGDSAKPPRPPQWVWQRGPWLLVDRSTGHIVPLKLPDYDPGVSQVSWFRDYAAYCGISTAGKNLYAVVAQLAVRKPVLAKKLAALSTESLASADRTCAPPEWQRDPLRVTFHPTGRDPASFDVTLRSAVLVEDADEETESKASRPD